jgi:hypothetical protein
MTISASGAVSLPTSSLTITSGATLNGGVVVNEDGADVDFRIESDTDANAFFLDGATGAIGVGVTPSAWDSTYKAFQISNSLSLMGASGAADIYANAYLNASSQFIYLANGSAAAYSLASGQHRWYTAPSGTAGNAITFTQAMTLDANKQLLLGTTSTTPITEFSGGSIGITVQSGLPTIALVDSDDTTNYISWLANSSGTLYLYNKHSTSPLIFGTNSVEAARITSGGDFGIGNSNPLYRLTVNKDTTSALGFFTNSNNSTPNGISIDFSAASPDNNTQYFLYCEDSTTARVILYSDGDGQNHDNSWGGISDERLKQDIVDANSQWDDIKNLRVRKYRFKSDVENGKEHAQIGLIAQEVMPVSPGLVIGSEDTQYGVQYSILYMKAVKALQEAMARIEQLEAKVATLESK